MRYIEFIGIPGSGKTTIKTNKYRSHKNSISFKKIIYNLKFLKRDALFAFYLVGFIDVRRFFYVIRHFIILRSCESDYIIDQGIIQIYLSHCSHYRKDVDLGFFFKI